MTGKCFQRQRRVAFIRSGLMDIVDRRLGLLMLLVKLNVVYVRKISHSHMHTMLNKTFVEPPCSIPLAVVSLQQEFLQFAPKNKFEDGDWY